MMIENQNGGQEEYKIKVVEMKSKLPLKIKMADMKLKWWI